jgi:hypothetical protein
VYIAYKHIYICKQTAINKYQIGNINTSAKQKKTNKEEAFCRTLFLCLLSQLQTAAEQKQTNKNKTNKNKEKQTKQNSISQASRIRSNQIQTCSEHRRAHLRVHSHASSQGRPRP